MYLIASLAKRSALENLNRTKFTDFSLFFFILSHSHTHTWHRHTLSPRREAGGFIMSPPYLDMHSGLSVHAAYAVRHWYCLCVRIYCIFKLQLFLSIPVLYIFFKFGIETP